MQLSSAGFGNCCLCCFLGVARLAIPKQGKGEATARKKGSANTQNGKLWGLIAESFVGERHARPVHDPVLRDRARITGVEACVGDANVDAVCNLCAKWCMTWNDAWAKLGRQLGWEDSRPDKIFRAKTTTPPPPHPPIHLMYRCRPPATLTPPPPPEPGADGCCLPADRQQQA